MCMAQFIKDSNSSLKFFSGSSASFGSCEKILSASCSSKKCLWKAFSTVIFSNMEKLAIH